MTKVAVIGAGIAGLAACKYSKQAKLEVDVFEQTNNIGGTWVYTDKIGTDKYGLQIHSSMYRNLHTNLPKETMGYHDYEYSGFERSYITPSEVMTFLGNYVEHFGLRDHIKFEHLVTKVEPLQGDQWSVTVHDLKKDESITKIYDAIFICNGHYSTPNVPKLQGSEYFTGKVMHSHDYRYPEPFKDQKVLIIGAGPSGVDITRDVSTTAQFVGFSHHLPSKILNAYDENVTQLPDVAQILDDGKVHFYDGQVLEFDTIIFCTGYKYVYPFLSPECQIKVEDNHVTELYKHIININYPTMYFIGIPFTTIIVPLADIQVRFCMKFLTNAAELPSQDEMRRDTNEDIYQRQLKGLPKRKMHKLGELMSPYLNDLVTIANVEPIKPVILDIYARGRYLMQNDIRNYRKYNYKIIDDYNFIQTM